MAVFEAQKIGILEVDGGRLLARVKVNPLSV